MKTDIQTELTQALLSHEKSMGERRKNHFSQKHSVGFGRKNRPDYYRVVIGE